MIHRTEASSHVNTTALQGAGPSNAPEVEVEVAALLPTPEVVSGDPVAMIAKLLVKSSQQKRESDDLSASVEEKAEDAADAKRIEAMKAKADSNFAAGVTGGVGQIASGAGGVATGLGGSAAWEPAGKTADGFAKVGEAFYKRDADRADQAIAKAESEAKVHKRASEALHKEVDAASQHEGKVMQLLQEIKQAQQQCERAALLKMA